MSFERSFSRIFCDGGLFFVFVLFYVVDAIEEWNLEFFLILISLILS